MENEKRPAEKVIQSSAMSVHDTVAPSARNSRDEKSNADSGAGITFMPGNPVAADPYNTSPDPDSGDRTDTPAPSYTEDEETYPEGGKRAWLVVLGSWLALFSALGLMNILATFQTYVSTHQLAEYDASTIGWIFSLYSFLSFFLGIYIGPIFDKYGPRWLVAAGTVCLAASLMLLSICKGIYPPSPPSLHRQYTNTVPEYYQFLLAFGVLSGLSCSLLFTPSIAAIGHFFKVRRGLATGVASTAGSLGGVIFPLMLESLFAKVGWAWAIRILGFLCLSLTVAANFLIRSRLPPAESASVHPDFMIFKDLPFALTVIAVFLLEFALFIPLTYISSYALSKGFSVAFSFQILTYLNVGSIFGRLLVGYWADHVGAFNANMISVVISIVANLAIWLPAGHTTPGLIIYALLFGFSSGSNISLTPVAIGTLCKTQNYGRYYATTYTIVSLACLVGVPIAGRILVSNGGDYWGLIVFTGCIYVGCLVAFMAAKVSVVGWHLWAIF